MFRASEITTSMQIHRYQRRKQTVCQYRRLLDDLALGFVNRAFYFCYSHDTNRYNSFVVITRHIQYTYRTIKDWNVGTR